MDLLHAVDVLSNAPQDTEDLNQRKEKTEACRVIADQVCAPSFRATPELFRRFLPSSITLLLTAHADKDLNVWTVAEESLNKILKVLIFSFHESIMLMLFRAINSSYQQHQTPVPAGTKPFPIKSQRAALSKFGLLCKYIRPARCRKFITSLQPPLQVLLELRSDEALQEAIATAMENHISESLVPHLREDEVQQMLGWFMKNLDEDNASVRRSATNSMISICRHYPKRQLGFVVNALRNFTPKDPAKVNHATLGTLFTYLQIAKLASELSKTFSSEADMLSVFITFFVDTIMECFKKTQQAEYDHNIIGAALELLSQMLSTHAEYPFLWPEKTLQNLVVQLHTLACTLPSSRVSTKAVSVSCLAQIAKFYPTIFADNVNRDELLALVEHNDPLLRGTTIFLLGCIIRGILGRELVSTNQIYPSHPTYSSAISAATVEAYVQHMLTGSFDASSVTARLSISGLGECLSVLSTSNFGSTVLQAISRLLNTDPTAYWLIKIEILETLSKLDYAVLHYLEQSPYNRAFHPLDQTHKGSTRSLQARVLDSDADGRVRNSAAQTLLQVIPRLVWPSPLDRSAPYKAILDYVRIGFDVYNQDDKSQKDINASVSQVVHQLIDLLRDGHPEDRVRGCYHALFLISETYSFPPNTPQLAITLQNGSLANPMSQFLGEIVPLAIDRLVVSPLATDLDTHLEVTMLIGYLCRGAPEQLLPYWKSVLRHLLRIVNMVS